jgi:hypothetical protein
MTDPSATTPPTPAQASPAALPEETHRLVRQLHDMAKSGQRSGGLQILTAILLSVATITSTWCGYQASRWSGVQNSKQAASDTAERHSAEHTLAGLQIRTQDGLVLLEYWRARQTGDERTINLMVSRMRPELRAALDASLEQGILQNPAVPGPLHQPAYVLEVEQLARADRQEAADAQRQAAEAGRNASEYVLVTLMLASVLFVGGVGNTFPHRTVRRVLASIAILVLILAISRMLRLPVLSPIAAVAGAG